MKNKNIFILLLITLIGWKLTAQQLSLPLSHAGACSYQGHTFVFGIDEGTKNPTLKIFRLNEKLSISDSAIISLNAPQKQSFLQCWADTTHGFLNVYVQKKEGQKAGIYRFNSKFKRVSEIGDIEITRLNSFSAFEKQIFYHRKDAYTLRVTNDSTGQLYFLNKYTLRSDSGNFTYDQNWQFPFNRKHVNFCRIITVDKHFVIMYANVSDGDKKGQWILKVNKTSGSLIRGTKLNDKGVADLYTFGQILYDSTIKSHYLFGSHYLQNEFDQKTNMLLVTNRKSVRLFSACIDSAGNLMSKSDYTLPIIEAKGVSYKFPVHYYLDLSRSTIEPNGSIRIYADVYKAKGKENCFAYTQSTLLQFQNNEHSYTLEKNSIGSNQLIEKFMFNPDPLNMNGKFCLDSLNSYTQLGFIGPSLPVKLHFKIDEQLNPIWLLKKSDLKKNTTEYVSLNPVNKVYKLNKIQEIPKNEENNCITSEKQFIIYRQSGEQLFQLNVYNW